MGTMFCGLGQDAMLEYIRYLTGGIGSYIVKCCAYHHRKVRLGQVGVNGCWFGGRFHMITGKGVAVYCCICAVCLCLWLGALFGCHLSEGRSGSTSCMVQR